MESEQSQAVAELFNMIFGYVKPMILKCALDVGIPHVLCNHGKPMTLNQLHSSLSLPISKKRHLLHLLRTLTHFGFIRVQEGATVDTEARYDLTPASRLLTKNEGSLNLLPFFDLHLQLLQDVGLKQFLCMGDWFKQDNTAVPFEMAHGSSFWEMASKNSELNKKFNSGTISASAVCTDAIVKCGADIFKGVKSFVDVAGGAGAVSKAIAANFPHVQCTVLDLPHVVDGLPNQGNLKFVPGDMFNYIPPADAVLLKSVLHCFGDEDSIKLLKRCKEAVSAKEVKGKVIILEPVLGSSGNAVVEETQLLYDMLMLSSYAGAERDEHEWKSLFTKAGYSSHKIVHSVGFMSIIEVYP